MINYYRKTHLEDFIEKIYIENGILTVDDITIDVLCGRLNIKTEKVDVESFSIYKEPKSIIFLNQRKTPQEQREDFLHELCHLLRHEGNQLVLPKTFVEYQEEDTKQFKLYALMPFFMIEQIDLSPNHGEAVKQLSSVFSVSLDLARKRYEQIMRREFEGAMRAEISATTRPSKGVKTVAENTITFAAYYDPSGAIDGPSQLIVNLDEWTLMNCRQIELPIGDRLPEIDLEEMTNIDCVTVHSSDVICFDGVVTLQVHELLHRYGLTKRCFIIHMLDVQMKIARDQEMTRKLSW